MTPAHWMNRWRKRVRALIRTNEVDRELDEELQFHLEMETQKNIRAGMTPGNALREAKLAFGAMHKHRGETRDARWLAWFPDMSLDFKLGARMLVKYPGLSLVSGLAMAFAIGVGAITFEVVTMLGHPRLGLPDADRIVQLWNLDVQASRTESRALRDFVSWRQALHSVTDLGAYREVSRNLIVSAGDAQPVQVAEITASAFRVAPEAPLLGRTLLESDEIAGAPPVVVIGYDVWRRRFDSDSSVIGRTVQVGEIYAAVVGVMRKNFAFPVSHELWMPLQVDGAQLAPRTGPAISMFGKLAPDVTLAQAQAELATIGRRATIESPNTHQYLQPRIARYAESTTSAADVWVMLAIPGFAVMLLVLVCGNVALLLFARAATRESELIVRSALGATRSRIVVQLFAEALVLGVVAAGVGLAVADFGLRRWGPAFLEQNMGRLPFWFDIGLSLPTVLYAIGLTILAAVIAGVLPALKVTSGMGMRLRQAAAGGGGLKFGGVWTAIIVAQVAATTAFPVIAFIEQQALVRIQTFEAGFRSEQYLAAMAEPDASGKADESAESSDAARFQLALEKLRDRVASLPGVDGVTFVDRLPRENHREFGVEVDDASGDGSAAEASTSVGAPDPLREVQAAYIDQSYFDVLQVPMLAGRAFQAGDLVPNARVAIVDQGFVDQVLRGRNAIGRRLRLGNRVTIDGSVSDDARPWYQIIGVVKELGMGSPMQRGRAAGVYLPSVAGHDGPTNIVVHTRGDPMSLVPQVRRVATEIDATLRLSVFQRVDQVTSGALWLVTLWLRVTILLTVIALLLSLAGIYAVMSFTVARRTREIGIRVALGANARRVVASIFKRPLTQVVAGVTVGAMLAGVMFVALQSCQDGVCDDGPMVSVKGVALLTLYAMLILAVCLLACVVPTRRALAVEPVEALRAE